MLFEIHNGIDRDDRLYQQWSELARTPLEHPDWLLSWWDSYGRENQSCSLYLITMHDKGELIAISPLFIKGSRLRLLGSGAVSTDHQELLIGNVCFEKSRQFVLWLLEQSHQIGLTVTELECVDEDSLTLSVLRQIASQRDGLMLSSPDTPNCKLELASSWESYLASLSRNHRKRCRRWDREYFHNDRATTRTTRIDWDFNEAFACFVELHNQRREDTGENAKLFECQRYHSFLKNAFLNLAPKGMAEISAVVLDGRVIAIEFELTSPTTVFAYQSGMISESPKSMSPGSLSIMSRIHNAIKDGKQTYDFMRGDEDYKFRWGATAQPTSRVKLWRTSPKSRIAMSSCRLWLQSKSLVREFVSSAQPNGARLLSGYGSQIR